jgi:two-component sensor histidine kinase
MAHRSKGGSLGALTETVELVTSELVTNAILAATELPAHVHVGLPTVHLRLLADDHGVVIEVWDANPHPPAPQQAAPDEERGRGLMLVDALCEQWGSEIMPGLERQGGVGPVPSGMKRDTELSPT